MTKNFIYGTSILLIMCLMVFISSCGKDKISTEDQSKDLLESNAVDYEVITENRTFQLQYLTEEGIYLENAGLKALESYMETHESEIFEIQSIPNKAFMFSDEISFYRYYREINDLEARNWILYSTIEKLKEGNYALNDEFVLEQLNELKDELSISNSVEELASLMETREVNSFSENGQSSPRAPVSGMWEHGNNEGAELCVECEADITTYGDYGCYTKAEIADLSTIPKSTGGDWNDVCSSICNDRVDGSISMGVKYFRHINFEKGGKRCHNWNVIYTKDSGVQCGNWDKTRWCWFGAKINDDIGGIRIKAIWEGCSINYDDL